MLSRIGRFIQLPAAEKRLILVIACLPPTVELGLRLFGFNPVYKMLDLLSTQPPSVVIKPKNKIAKLSYRFRQIIQRHPLAGRCLAQSLALWWLLRKRGIDTELRFGQRKHKGCFEAHAWLEYRGHPINDSPSVTQKYVPFCKALRPQN